MSELDRYQNRLDELRALATDAERIVVAAVVYYRNSSLLPGDFEPRFPAFRAIVRTIHATGKTGIAELSEEMAAADSSRQIAALLARVTDGAFNIPSFPTYLRQVATEATEFWDQYDALNNILKQAEALLGAEDLPTNRNPVQRCERQDSVTVQPSHGHAPASQDRCSSRVSKPECGALDSSPPLESQR